MERARGGNDAESAASPNGQARGVERLTPLLYDELRGIAERYMRGEGRGHTLQPTALVNEAYMRLARYDWAEAPERSQFLALAARAMRRILTEHARARRAAKRGGRWQRWELDSGALGGEALDVVALDDALQRLEEIDPRQYRVVELRYFAGMPMERIAALLGVSKSTVEGDWRMARAWLRREFAKGAL